LLFVFWMVFRPWFRPPWILHLKKYCTGTILAETTEKGMTLSACNLTDHVFCFQFSGPNMCPFFQFQQIPNLSLSKWNHRVMNLVSHWTLNLCTTQSESAYTNQIPWSGYLGQWKGAITIQGLWVPFLELAEFSLMPSLSFQFASVAYV